MKLVGWLLILLCPVVQADIFTWTDADGRVHYGDQPPADSTSRQLDPGQANVSTIGGSELREGELDTLERFEQRRPEPAPVVVTPAPIIIPNPAPPPVQRTRIVTRHHPYHRYHPRGRKTGFRLELGGDRWRFRLHSGDRPSRYPYHRRFRDQRSFHRPGPDRDIGTRQQPSAPHNTSRPQPARLPR